MNMKDKKKKLQEHTQDMAYLTELSAELDGQR